MTQLWEFTSGGTNDFATLIYKNKEQLWAGIFDTNGKPKHWGSRPCIEPFFDKRKKTQKPMADIGFLAPGTIILNAKAYAALKDFLLRFGGFLELDCQGDVHYFYNVTNLIACIDVANSEKSGGMAILKAVFLPAAIPNDAQIFKDPLTAGVRIFLTQAAKDVLDKIIGENHLTGLQFFEAGKKW